MTRTRLALLILLGVGGLVWLVERLIVTDAEAIEATVEGLATHAAAGDWVEFEALLAPDFDSQWGDRSKFPKAVADLMKQFEVKEPSVSVGTITVRGDQAGASVTVRARGYPVPARVDLVRTEEGWRVVGATSDLAGAGWRRVR